MYTFLSLHLISSFSIVSLRIESSQPVHSFHLMTSCLSSSTRTSPSCFKLSVIPLENHSLLRQLLWDTGHTKHSASDIEATCILQKYRKSISTECFCPFLSHLKRSSVSSYWRSSLIFNFCFDYIYI